MQRAQTQNVDGLEITVAALDARESHRFFGVPMGRRGIQPVWVRVVNRESNPYRLLLLSVDPNYYTPLEAAAVNHYSDLKRLLGFGALAWLFLPFLLLLLLQLIGARRANRKMDEFFRAQGFPLRPIPPGGELSGFIFTSLDVGNKVVHVRLLGAGGEKQCVFNVAVPGLDADYLRHEIDWPEQAAEAVECDLKELRKRLTDAPATTTNGKSERGGDPANLVLVGEFAALLGAFGGRWDQTEVITLATSWKTARSFLLGSEYRYSPVSSLYLWGRRQDFALQRVRQSINERLHLRMWATPLRFGGRPVWVGQVSRDIGVRFTWRTWNLTTHRIDPDTDEARDYVVEDLLGAERIELVTYCGGVGTCDRQSPRRNLTGDPYFTDGRRAVVVVSGSRTTPRFLGLDDQSSD